MRATSSDFKTLAVGIRDGLYQLGITMGDQAPMFHEELPMDNPDAYKRRRKANRLSGNLDTLLRRKRVSPALAARETGIPASTLYDWLNSPNALQLADERLPGLSRYLGVPLEDLLYGEIV